MYRSDRAYVQQVQHYTLRYIEQRLVSCNIHHTICRQGWVVEYVALKLWTKSNIFILY